MNKNSHKDYKEANNIMNSYPNNKRYTLAILQDVQREYGYIPREVMNSLSEYLGLPISKIFSISTFYKSLSLEIKGKFIIKVCDGTACHIRGSKTILEELQELLGIKPGETTEDGLFSMEIVNCLGACALAPVMAINGKYYGKMNKDKIKSIIDEYKGACINE